MSRSPLFWIFVGVAGYWGIQHFTGLGTSGKGAHASPGGLAA
jgi:hypothetical protein